ncbi:MAG TPA: N-acetylmuramoyl-L-alanine amidase, partial [Porphyromonadaceae bacterium]|nr:N-acetylmuramoyl-L-alanine amidase [Porphyromonadaceae bacterium]
MSFHYKYRYISVLSLFLICLFAPGWVWGQSRLRVYEEYIDNYSDIAVRHMNDYNIPASITLAQGLLESGAGMSDLARRSNNH